VALAPEISIGAEWIGSIWAGVPALGICSIGAGGTALGIGSVGAGGPALGIGGIGAGELAFEIGSVGLALEADGRVTDPDDIAVEAIGKITAAAAQLLQR
jgi:hypothetical protein